MILCIERKKTVSKVALFLGIEIAKSDLIRGPETVFVSGGSSRNKKALPKFVGVQPNTQPGRWPIHQTSSRRSETMSDGLMCITNNFEGRALTTLTYKGRPAWIAREVGAVMGYSHGGKRLANKITGDWSVLPQNVRDGAYFPERRVEDGQVVTAGHSVFNSRDAREQRLARRLELEDRKFKVQTLRRTIKDIEKTISAEAITILQVVAAEIALERDLSDLKPALGSGWVQPSEIAKRLGVFSNRIGRVIRELGLRGDMPGLSKSIMNKAQHGDRNVVSYLYSPAAVKQIEERLREEGQRDVAANDFN
jgi:hypothetical protein